MLRSQNFTRSWGNQRRENRIIFIGRGMQQRREELTKATMACVAPPLRFSVGDAVQARTGETEYTPGHVIAHWDNFNAYRIKLKDGREVWAPHDHDNFIKKGSGGGYEKK